MGHPNATGRNGTQSALAGLVEAYSTDHPKARIDYYLLNRRGIRLRIIDPFFEGLGIFERHDHVWKYIARLPQDFIDKLDMVVPIAPGERKFSGYNLEYEDEKPKPTKAKR